jgi:YD repeat-containing protein
MASTYYYDTNPFDGAFSTYAWGRLTAVRWGSPDPAYGMGQFTEMYGYTVGGAVARKRLRLNRGTNDADLDASFVYDNEGRPSKLTMQPMNPFPINERPVEFVKDVTYGPAGELTAMKHLAGFAEQFMWATSQMPYYNQTRTYNPRLQLTRMSASGSFPGAGIDMEYRYPATQNNGQITQSKDYLTGEEVTYTYDALNRLIAAVTTGPEWGLSFSYDGFGNRMGQNVTKGSAPMANLVFDANTNRVLGSGHGYDASGNVTSLPLMTLGYDAAGRLAGVAHTLNGTEEYGYTPDNRRVWKKWPNGRASSC